MIIDRFIFWQLLATLDNFPDFFHSLFCFSKTKTEGNNFNLLLSIIDPASYLLHFFYVLKRLRSTTNSVIFQLLWFFVFHYVPQFVCHILFPVYIILIKKALSIPEFFVDWWNISIFYLCRLFGQSCKTAHPTIKGNPSISCRFYIRPKYHLVSNILSHPFCIHIFYE